MTSTPDFEPPARTAPIRWPSLPWAAPTFFAPMEGVTHPLLRSLMAERGGIGVLCTEFVRIADSYVSEKHMRRQVVKVDGVPLSVQVMGTHVEHMAAAAGMVARAGADVVDINLGCPAPRVVRKGAGSAMLKDPQLLYDVICAMRDEVPGMLSAKIRAGFDDAGNVVRIARTVESAGADFIAVHPRRRADFYQGVADWRIIRVLKDALQIPVIGNGDVWYAQDALRMMEETGCDAVMIGRPALRNPWIFRQIADLRAGREPEHPDGTEVFELFDAWVALYRATFTKTARGPVGKIKEWITWLGRAVDDGGQWRKAALRLHTLDDILALTERSLVGLPAERIDLSADGHLGFETSGSCAGSADAA